MDDLQSEGAVEAVAVDTADAGIPEDRFYDNLHDAAEALADDDEGEAPEGEPEEQPDEPEGDEPADVNEDEADPEEEAGKLRMADYTRKTQELARERETVHAMRDDFTKRTQDLQTVYQRFQQFAEGLIPPEPPLQMAQQNPAEYQYQMALRHAAMQEIQGVFAVGQDLDTQAQGFSEAELARYRDSETASLVKVMPELKDPAKKAQFDIAVAEAAREFGFTDDEIAQTADHRVLQLVHFARIGKRAEHNRKNAQRRVAEAPKKGTEGRAAQPRDRNAEAMRRLERSGSLKDALAIDFD